jgi:Flp pilus assembly protein TadD
LQRGPYTSVLKNFNQAINLAPWSEVLKKQVVAYLNEQFRAYYSRADYTNALAFLKLATEVNPMNAEVHEDYGMMLRMTDQPEAATQELLQALTLDSSLVFAHRLLGNIYATRGEKEKALEHWNEALSSNPDDVGTLVAKGVHLARNGSVPEGKEYIQRAYYLAKKNPEVINAYALVTSIAGDYAAALNIVHDGGRYYEENDSYERLRQEIIGMN